MQASTQTVALQSSPRAAVEPQRRFDMYGSIHKALRVYMTDVLAEVGRLDTTDPADVEATVNRVKGLVRFMRLHLTHENDFIHAAMERAVPGSTQYVAEDHVEHVRTLDLLDNEATAVARSVATARAAAAARLYRHLALVTAENFEHMEVEESENNAVLWGSYNDQELVSIHDALIKSLPKEEIVEVLTLMLPNISPAERAGLYSGMQASAPAEVFQALLGLARSVLSERDFGKLSAALGPRPIN